MANDWQKELRIKLLDEGGGFVVASENEPDIVELLAKGKIQNYPVKKGKGKEGLCHKNVAQAFLKGEGVIATGYALSKDGGWRQHSWIVQKKSIIETAGQPREAYWGIEIKGQEASLWAQRQLPKKWRWWQPLGLLLIIALLALAWAWARSGALIPGGGV